MQARGTHKNVPEYSVALVSGTSPGMWMKPVGLSSDQNLLFLVCFYGWHALSQKYSVSMTCFLCIS